MIPKNIIYTWFGRKPKPDSFDQYARGWKHANPGFEIIEINEDNFDVNSFAFTKFAYENGMWAFVSDVARIWAVNKYGGIYLDTDVEVISDFDFLMKFPQFWGKEDVGLVASGLIFGSEPNDPILNEILLAYSEITLPIDSFEFVTTVRVVSAVLSQHGLTNTKKRDYLDNGSVVFEPKIFAPLHYWGGGHISRKSVTVHHYDASWLANNSNYGMFKFVLHELIYIFPLLATPVRKVIGAVKGGKNVE